MGFYRGKEFLRYIAEHDKSKTRWDHLETGAFALWDRGSPRPLAVRWLFLQRTHIWIRMDGRPTVGYVRDDPGHTQPGRAPYAIYRISPAG